MIGFDRRSEIAKKFMTLKRGNKTVKMERVANTFGCSLNTVRKIINKECKWIVRDGKRTGFWLVSKNKTQFVR